MKKLRWPLFFAAIITAMIVLLTGCNSFQIDGLDKFNESDCCFGLNDMLLPDNREFLSNYPYESGDYHYWRNNYGKAQAKTYVQLTYSEEVYQQAKFACLKHFTISEEQYLYNTFVFYGVNISGGDTALDAAFPGIRLLGYSDDTCSLVFLGYLDETGKKSQIDSSNFVLFLNNHFGEWIGPSP